MTLSSVDEILDFAMNQEQQSVDFYTDLAEKMVRPWMKKVFEDFAKEEMTHKAMILGIKKGNLLLPDKEKVMDLKITEYLVMENPKADMDYQDALILAMKKEKAAFRMYNDLAAATDDKGVKTTFLSLAQEEAKHKLYFEIEYDEIVLTDN